MARADHLLDKGEAQYMSGGWGEVKVFPDAVCKCGDKPVSRTNNGKSLAGWFFIHLRRLGYE